MFKIVSSSAGSGKTYTLTKEYLKLVLQNDNAYYFKHILAITFTKAATREMKERILGRLQVFAEGGNDPMLADIIRELYPQTLNDPEGAYKVQELALRTRAERVFKQILHDYSDFAVMTIDSFVQRVVSAFTDELGMPFSFEVEMEAGELLTMAVERLLERTGDDSYGELTDILESFYLEAGQEGQNYHNLPEALAGFAKDLLNEQRYAAIVQNSALTAKDFKKIRRQLVTFKAKIETPIQRLAREALEVLANIDCEISDYANSDKGFYSFFRKCASFDSFPELNKNAEKTAKKGDWSSSKASKYAKEKLKEVSGLLAEKYYKIVSLLSSDNKELYILYQQLIPHLYHLSLLNEIKEEFDRQLRENNRVHISEFNQKILKIVTEDPVPFIYERLGEKFNHILIDEFQDTSKLQFANLLPLIDNSLGYEHFNLAVGDSKQAIYRFRGGDMDQIIALHSKKLDRLYRSLGDSELTMERLENIRWHLKDDVLRTNRRSAREIIEFNNTFFETVEQLYRDQFPLAQEVFAQVAQEIPPSPKTGGQVNIEFVEGNEGDDENDTPVMISRTLELIRQVTEQEGFSLGDVSVLCRFKRDAKKIANHLKENGYNIISDDSLSLRFSAAVNLVTAFMRVLVKPDSRLDKYEALYLYYRLILDRIPDANGNQFIKKAVESTDVHLFYEYVNKLQDTVYGQKKLDTLPSNLDTHLTPYKFLQMSAYELSEKLIQVFRLFQLVDERDYLFRFLDVVLEFSTQRGSHLADFLEYWETQKDKISISAPSDPNAITVQTIHRSKGLEYPIVIIPYADWEFVPSAKRDTMWVNLEPSEALGVSSWEAANVEAGETIEFIEKNFLKTGSVRVTSALEQTPDAIATQYREEYERVFVENLNLLYVAFTRPTRRLYVLAKGDNFEKIKNPRRISYWLYQYQQSAGSKQQLVDSSQVLAGESPRHSTLDTRHSFYIPNVISTDRSRELRLRRLANRVFDVETFEQKKDHGNKVHYALSKVKTPSDVPTALAQMQTDGVIDNSESAEIQKSLENILKHPDLKGLFEVENDVLNEREILTPDGNLHRPDRVVFLPDDHVVILDYKTGVPLDSHSRQIKRYVNLFKEMGHKRVEALLVYIERNEVVKI